MSDDLPEGCQLRVRAAPDPAAAELLVVTRDDEIYASERRGDWLRVELPGPWTSWKLAQRCQIYLTHFSPTNFFALLLLSSGAQAPASKVTRG
jgi:hypothetical protein